MTFGLFTGCRRAFPTSRGLSWWQALRLPRSQHPPHATRPAPSRLVLWLILGSLLLAGCNANRAGSGTTPTASSPATQISPAWTAVLNQIGPNGEISLSTALQAYTLVFGPLPGVQAPPNAGGRIPSGSLAVRMILQHYQDLTSAQQQAVLQRLGLTAPAAAEASAPGATSVAAAAQTLARPWLQPPVAPTPPADAPGTAPYRDMLNTFIPKYDSFLQLTYTLPIVLLFFQGPTTADGEASAVNAHGGITGTPALCRIYVDPALNKSPLDYQQLVIAHELFHCYQAMIGKSLYVYYHAPAWLIEGSAEWAGMLVSGATSDSGDAGYWVTWLAHPEVPLFQRAYTAIGFYALLDQSGISAWSVLPDMLTSQTDSNVPNNLAAYQEGTKRAPQEVLDEWASSYERDPALGLDWNLTGPGIVPASRYGGAHIHGVTLANLGHVAVATPAYTAIDYGLSSQADVVLVNITGTSRLKDSAGVERVTSANGSYCTKQGGCTCPPGSPNQDVQLRQLTGLLHLAVTGGPQGAKGIVYGLTLAKFCGKTLPPITLAFCQQLLSLAEANQIMSPSAPATLIQVFPFHTVSAGLTSDGLCDYLSSPSPAGLVVQIRLGTYSGPTPISDDQVKEYFSKGLNPPGKADISVTPVSGVGDQAGIVVGSYTINGSTSYGAAFWVLYGSIVFDCGNVYSSSPTATQQSELQQCAQLIVSRLDP
jgi:hypothetical protein